MEFNIDTYIVLDIPSPFAEQMQEIRECYDPRMATLPIEITVVGSSGIGTFHKSQDSETAFAILDDIASEWPPIKAAFTGVSRFPNTDIYYLVLHDHSPFINLQTKIAATSLRFNNNPFLYTPHCTIHLNGNFPDNQVEEILTVPIPENEFLLDTLSIYSLNKSTWDCQLLHRTELRGIE